MFVTCEQRGRRGRSRRDWSGGGCVCGLAFTRDVASPFLTVAALMHTTQNADRCSTISALSLSRARACAVTRARAAVSERAPRRLVDPRGARGGTPLLTLSARCERGAADSMIERLRPLQRQESDGSADEQWCVERDARSPRCCVAHMLQYGVLLCRRRRVQKRLAGGRASWNFLSLSRSMANKKVPAAACIESESALY